MNLRTYILVFIILLASGEYFTGKTNRLPRVDVKSYLVVERPDKLAGRSWMEDTSKDNVLDLKEHDCIRVVLYQPGESFNHYINAGSVHLSQLSPLLLDRPPPFQV